LLPTNRIAYLGTAGDCCAAGFRANLCPLWVKIGLCGDVRCTTALPPRTDLRRHA